MTVINAYPWHAPLWEKMDSYFDKKRFPHALLFWGARGLGKQDFVEGLAARLLCLKEMNSPCGHCESCHWIKCDTHADKIFLAPASGKKVIRVDEVRSLSATLNRTSHAGRGFVVIIRLVEQMNHEAHNALLKLLEEPPSNTYFLLISEQIALLPQTIRSRCQTCYFPLVSTKSVKAYLKEQQCDPSYAFLLNGAPLSYKERSQPSFLTLRKETHNAVVALAKGTLCPVKAAATWLKAPLDDILDILLMWLLDALKWKSMNEASLLVNQDCLATLKTYTQSVSNNQMMSLMSKINAFKASIYKQSNLNQQLCLEDLAISFINKDKL